MTSMEWHRLDSDIKRIIAKYTAEPPVKIATLARELGLQVKSATLRPGVSGEIRPVESDPNKFKIRVNRHEIKERQRFTIAHELAHYLLHKDLIRQGISDNILYRSRLSSTVEAEANRLAADLLMPSTAINERLAEVDHKISEDLVRELAESFGVSVPAMSIRVGL